VGKALSTSAPGEDGNSFLLTLIGKLSPSSKQVREWIQEIRKNNKGISKDDLAEYVASRIVWTYTGQGVALGLPGAIPGLGTIAQVVIESGAVTADIALMVRNQTYLVFALGHCYGIRGRETLIQDSLICMGLWSNALVLTKSGAIRIGTKVLAAQFKKNFPAKILQAINRKVGTTILTKYGTKRGGVAIGKLIPFGVGAVVGGAFNYAVMKHFKNRSIEFFRLTIR